ncbi:MAG TPA: hypothetical protein VNT32_09475 [Thermoleophilaceae bacterium]|nr:hypothetical protein [Thermoleophilaceae bacterium]
MTAGSTIRTRSEKQRLSRRNSQLAGAAGFVLAALLPYALWHRAIGLVAEDFRFELDYLVTGWTGYGMMVAGLLFLVPVVVSIGRSPNSRLYPRARNAYVGWGLSLYVLGLGLASQVASITRGATAL